MLILISALTVRYSDVFFSSLSLSVSGNTPSSTEGCIADASTAMRDTIVSEERKFLQMVHL